MTVFPAPIRYGNLRGNWAKDPSFVQQNPEPTGVYSRDTRSSISGTTLAGPNTTLERTWHAGALLRKKVD